MANCNWRDGKAWSDQFIPEIKQRLGESLGCNPAFVSVPADVREDQVRNTDLFVLQAERKRVACRVRRNSYLRFASTFTMRSRTRSGFGSELQKVLAGWGDIYFYAFADGLDRRLSHWWVCDLNVFRDWYQQCVSSGVNRWSVQSNGHGDTGFHSFKWRDMPGAFVVNQSRRLEPRPHNQHHLFPKW